MNQSARNKTIQLTAKELKQFSAKLVKLQTKATKKEILNKTICQNLFDALDLLPDKFVDLMIIDPPYNLNKRFNKIGFQEKSILDYADWMESFISKLKGKLKENSSVYFCGDWYSSISIPLVLEKHFKIRNRITWEREKGRGSKHNWKNATEDIWYCTLSNKFTFNSEKVKLLKRVIAPYKNNGEPKDWKQIGENGYRLTHHSNIWTDISIPFWSMTENTDHPTQKPEKLIAKLILASSNEGDVILDPFLGSGTTSVVAKKLGRKYIGIEMDEFYAAIAEKRLLLAEEEKTIQGYTHEIFWERNTTPFKING